MTQLVAEEILNEFEKNNIALLSMICDINGEGVLRLHKEHEWKEMMKSLMRSFARVDDGAVLFNNRDDIITDTKIICIIIKKWRLTSHEGCDGKKSKTDLMSFPSTMKLKVWRNGTKDLTIDEGGANRKRAMKKSKPTVSLDKKYSNAIETEKVMVDENRGNFEFTKQLTCLESAITCLMDDTVDMRQRMIQATNPI